MQLNENMYNSITSIIAVINFLVKIVLSSFTESELLHFTFRCPKSRFGLPEQSFAELCDRNDDLFPFGVLSVIVKAYLLLKHYFNLHLLHLLIFYLELLINGECS